MVPRNQSASSPEDLHLKWVHREANDSSLLITSYFWYSVVNRSSVITCELIPSTCASLNGSPVRDICCFYPCHSGAFHQVLGFCCCLWNNRFLSRLGRMLQTCFVLFRIKKVKNKLEWSILGKILSLIVLLALALNCPMKLINENMKLQL